MPPIKRSYTPRPVKVDPPKSAPPSDVLRFTAWSASRLKTYETCAQQAYLKHLDKTVEQEPGSPQMHEGSYVDWLAEAWSTKNYALKIPDPSREEWVKHWGEAAEERRGPMKKGVIPPELASFEEAFDYLRARNSDLHPQEQISLDKDWKVLPPNAWFDARSGRTRVRVKMDVWWDEECEPGRIVRRIVDFKNGKVRQEDLEQTELYALVALVMGAEEAMPELWYLKAPVNQPQLPAILPEEPRVYTLDDLPRLKKKWESKAAPMLADTVFKTTTGRHCEWCFFNAANGGPCNAPQTPKEKQGKEVLRAARKGR